jgi:L-ascorbate metabolism protein UlaG (beta-lactamase superfamily)
VLRGWADAAGPAAHSLDLGEMLVRNVTTDVRSRFGDDSRGDGNSIFIFEVAGLCVGHLGHLHHVPDDAQFASIGRLDVVMVPVDGGYTMNVADMADVVRRLRSSVVVPMHWFSGASLEVFLTEMAGQFDVVRPEMSEIELSLDNLPRRPTIMVLEPEYLQ